MIHYVKQRDKFRCGPVAVLNSLRWVGADVSANYVYELSEKCKTKSYGMSGTNYYNFDRILRDEGQDLVNVKLILKPRLYEIEEHLREGGVVVLNYAWGQEDSHRHYTFIPEESETGKTFVMVNEFDNRPAVTKVRRKTFVNRCFAHRNDDDAKAWLLTKV